MNLSTTSPFPGDFYRASKQSDDRPQVSNQIQDAAPAICRICRGEGTASEPLFYPCKCSGSIKYVHQDCLMEWLSHSQKKHCELCKTSFRFTKLYAPNMPQSLPVHVFLEHMTKYLFRNALTWLRAIVAFSVWVLWLPYLMRAMWSFMFWVSDEGLVSAADPSQDNALMDHLHGMSPAILGRETCAASPLFFPMSTSLSAAGAMKGGPESRSASELIVRLLFASVGIPIRVFWQDSLAPEVVNASASASASVGGASTVFRSSTLLSDVTFLRKLTGGSILHHSLVSILEGQLITVVVILSFILIILVRDYVIQQQPDINMRAAFEAHDDAPDPVLPAAAAAEHIPDPAMPIDVHDLAPAIAHAGSDSDDATLDESSRHADGQPPIADSTSPSAPLVEGPFDAAAENTHTGPPKDSSMPEAPPDSSSKPQSGESPPNADDVAMFFRIFRQAHGDPEEMRRIARDEGLESELGYWLEIARQAKLKKSRTLDSWAPDHTHGLEEEGESSGSQPIAPGSDSMANGNNKAKDQAELSGGVESPLIPPQSDPRVDANRPRAASSGPQPTGSGHPLGNDNWSFSPDTNDSRDLGRPIPSSSLETRSNGLVPISLPIDQDPSRAANTSDDSSPAPFPVPGATSSDAAELEAMTDPTTSADAIAITTVDEEPKMPETEALGGLVGRVTNFMWGDLEPELEEHEILGDPENGDGENPWVDVHSDDEAEDDDFVGDDDIDDAEDGAGFDADAVDDLDDFEGIMELLGMRGPIAGLFQNAIFCSVLVSVTIFACVFVPYNIGRVSVWVVANPMVVVRMLLELSKLVQDAVIALSSIILWTTLHFIAAPLRIFGGRLASLINTAESTSLQLFKSSLLRVLELVFKDFPASASEMQNFSAISHESLIVVKGHISSAAGIIASPLGTSALASKHFSLAFLSGQIKPFSDKLVAFSVALLDPSSWVIDLGEPPVSSPVDPELAYWSGVDRVWAILAGYATVFLIGALYLRRGTPFSNGRVLQAWEASVIDTLHQASGIIKVILVISIEMLVFPLYCGLLLDVALLPLFENATISSRLTFTCTYPLTSAFVHWFVGTGYMFHFALFVSMCRKIMRPGVLYFIRDPDDPEFHPVRDVLERNLTTQLRKILFSAFVYGALVIVCLGGVVWGLSLAAPGVLPIHYSSNEPVLEFPVDLLFYNFLMPLAVKVFQPSDGLQLMYTWWFRKLARTLRLTYFLFGERRIDEEGDLQLRENSPHNNATWLRRCWLELNEKNNEVVPKTWPNLLEDGDAQPNPQVSGRHMKSLRRRKAELVESGQLLRSGRFVRAPASDRVKIPKGKKVFLTVTERDSRRDDRPDDDLYASNQYQVVYIPPRFGPRIFAFVVSLWLFAAITGVGLTIVPLVVGRLIFKKLIPAHIRTNDIYAFSIGVHYLGSAVYVCFHLSGIIERLPERVAQFREALQPSRVASMCARGAKLFYAYFFMGLVFPLLIATLMELYITIPLHTYIHPPKAAPSQGLSDQDGPDPSRHNIRVVQAWTLGILYLKLGASMTGALFPNSRLDVGVRTVFRRGWLRPDISILTRAFIIPGLVIGAAAIFIPPYLTSVLKNYGVFHGSQLVVVNEAAEAARMAVIYRRSYPVAAFAALVLRHAIGMVQVFNGWTARIRDEAYLIGERLHNFGVGPGSSRKGKGAWRAGGPRL